MDQKEYEERRKAIEDNAGIPLQAAFGVVGIVVCFVVLFLIVIFCRVQ
jgi:hypothetical protein